jgi:hypothetical protein
MLKATATALAAAGIDERPEAAPTLSSMVGAGHGATNDQHRSNA